MFFRYISCPSDKKIVASCKVIVFSIFNKLIASKFTVFSKEHPTRVFVNKRTGNSFNHTAILSKKVSAKIFAFGSYSVRATSQSKTFVIEEILFAFNFMPFVFVITERIIITSVFYSINYFSIPSTNYFTFFAFNFIYTIFCKSKGSYRCITGTVIEVVSIFANYNESFFLEVTCKVHPSISVIIESSERIVGKINTILIKCVHFTINEKLAYNFFTILVIRGVVFVPSVAGNNTVNISFAVGMNTTEEFTAVYASKLAFIIDCIFVSKCRNGGSPIKNSSASFGGITIMTFFRLGYTRTTCTEYTVNIAFFGTSSSLILYFSCRMEMPTALIILQEIFLLIFSRNAPPASDLTLGINLNFITGEHLSSAISKFNKTC